MSEDEYKVYEIALPATVYGAVRVDCDGFYSVYINRDLSPKTKKAVLRHELNHLERNDFYNNRSIYLIEDQNA